MSQAQINRLKADMQKKRRAYNNSLKSYGAYHQMTVAFKVSYERALAKLNAARAARDAAAAETTSSAEPYALARSIAEANRPQTDLTPGQIAMRGVRRQRYEQRRAYYRQRRQMSRGRPFMFRRRPYYMRRRSTDVSTLPAFQAGGAYAPLTQREEFVQRMQSLDGAEMGALALELGALEAELDAIHADMSGFGGMHYGDLGADGRGATAAAATGAGAAGAAGGLALVGGGSIATGATAATTGASIALVGGTAGAAAALAPAALVVAAAAAPAAGVAWLASWRASTKNVARLQKKIKALRKKMKLAVANAKSRGKKRRLKRRYQRRIDRAKNRLDRIKRVMRRRIQRAKRAGKMDKVKKLRAMRRAAQYGRGRKKMLARKKRRQAKRAAAQGESGEAAALEAEAAQIDSLPDESFVTEEDYELDPEIAAQLGPGALAVQQARMAQGLPPTATQASINRAKVLNAMLRRRRQNATGLDDDMLMDETMGLMPPESPRDYLDDDLGAASFLRDEEGKIKPVVYVAGAVAGLFVLNKMRQKKG